MDYRCCECGELCELREAVEKIGCWVHGRHGVHHNRIWVTDCCDCEDWEEENEEEAVIKLQRQLPEGLIEAIWQKEE